MKPPRLTVGLLLAALALLVLAPSALGATTTRVKTTVFGPAGPGSCALGALATGTGDLHAATGTGEPQVLGTGAGELTNGSKTVTNLATYTGTFSVGESIWGSGIPTSGATIAAVGLGTLTLSVPAVDSGPTSLTSASKTIADVNTTSGAFAVGMAIRGTGIPAGTTIAAVGANTLTLSAGPRLVFGSVALFAGSTVIDSLSAGCGTFAVGQQIAGAGIPAGTKIVATGAGTLTISNPPTKSGTGIALSATAPFAVLRSLGFGQGAGRLFAVDDGTSEVHALDLPSLAPAGAAFPLAVDPVVGTPVPPFRLAVDNSGTATDGRVYLLEPNERKIYGFDPSGAPLGGNFPLQAPFPLNLGGLAGIDVDSAGNLFIGDSFSTRVIRFDPAGNLLPSISLAANLGSVALDSADNLWVNYFAGEVRQPDKYTAASNYTSVSEPLATAGLNTVGMAVDRSSDQIYVTRPDGVSVFNAVTGAFLYSFAEGIQGESLVGFAIDPASGVAYVADRGDGTGGNLANAIYAYSPAQSYADATATPSAASNVLATSAVLGATIDDNSAAPTNWRLEYSSNGGSTWTKAGSGQTAGGQSGVAVSATAGGLALNTDYTFRVVTNKTTRAATDVPSSTLSFKTANPAAPTVTLSSSDVSYFSAKLGASIDDNGASPTSWRFQLSSNGGSSWNNLNSGATAGGQSGAVASAVASGLTVNTDYSFRIVTNKGATAATEVASAPQSFKTLNPAAPTVTLNPAASITDSTALLSASVDDNDTLPTRWRFELSVDGGAHWSTAATGQTPGAQSGFSVSRTATGLDPNTSYRFRIVTNKGSTPATEVPSTPQSFKTVAPPPAITDTGAVDVTDTSARLAATIDPRNTPTGYVFQYGTTPALGQSTAPVNIGGGLTPIVVSEVITGLDKDSDYYFRVAATNLTGTTQSPSKLFHTRATPLPDPDQRGYEQVSPVDKNYTDVSQNIIWPALAGVSLDGDAVGFCTTALFGEPAGRMTTSCAPYISRRTGSGWQTTNPFPSFCLVDPESGSSDGVQFAYPSPDYSRFVLARTEQPGCSVPPLDPAAPLSASGGSNGSAPFSKNLYREDPSTDPTSHSLLAGQNDNNFSDGVGTLMIGGSEDFSHVVYASYANQTAPPDSPAAGEFRKIYDWSAPGIDGCAQAGGCLTDLAKDANGTPFATDSDVGTPLGSYRSSAISTNGRRIYFQNPMAPPLARLGPAGCTPQCRLYMRENGATTYDVSASECVVAGGCGNGGAFVWANPAGDVAIFSSDVRHTDDPADHGGLYRWDENAPAGHRLIALTADHEPADGLGPSLYPGGSVLGGSDDGSVVYFFTPKQIVAGEPTDPAQVGRFGELLSGGKLYRWSYDNGNPSVDYLGPYQSLKGILQAEINLSQERRTVSDEGRYLLIYSRFRYDPAADHDADADLYRWEEQGGWTCISCQAPGAPSGGDVGLYVVRLPSFLTQPVPSTLIDAKPTEEMSSDGQRIFFATPDALLPQDTNGEGGCPLDSSNSFPAIGGREGADIYTCNDVYEWHDGALSLITPGDAAASPRLIGIGGDGRDVFFYSSQKLVGSDTDTNVDIYDARIGGGFPEPPPVPPACDLDSGACAGPATVAPNIPGAGTAAFQGPVNPQPTTTNKRCPKGKRKVRRGGKVRCVKPHHLKDKTKHNRQRRARR